MSWKPLIWLAAIALLSASPTVAADEAGRHPPEKVTLQLKFFHQFQFAGYYAAKAQGYYAQEGLDVDIRERQPGQDYIRQVIAGEIDYGIGDSGLVAHYAKGDPIVALAAIFQHDALVLFSKQSSGIISPYEMAGKRIMYDTIGENNAPIRALLAEADLDENLYTAVTESFNTEDLLQDKVDAISGYLTDKPFEFNQRGIKINVINPQSYGIDFYGDLLFTSRNELSRHPGRAERFRRASLKGWQYALAHPGEIIQLIQHQYHSRLSGEQLRFEAAETRKLIMADSIPLGQIETRRLRRVAALYSHLKLTPPLSEAQLNGFIYRAAVELNLSERERVWLAAHPTIRVGIDRDFAPYEWLDENGNYVGMIADHLKLVEQRLKVKFEIVKDKSWQEILDMARRGELDMIAAAVKTPDREQYLSFSQPYVSTPAVIIGNENIGYIGTLQQLNGRKVAVEQGYFVQEMLGKEHPQLQLLSSASVGDALMLVAAGKADAYVGDAASASYAIKRLGLLNLRFAGQTRYVSESRMAVVKAHPELLSILDKALADIPQSERDALINRWMGLKVPQGIATETLIRYALAALSILLLFAYWIYRLRREVRARKRSEEKLRLSARVFSDAHEGIVITDVDVHIIDVNAAFCEITGYSREEVIGKNPGMLKSGYQDGRFYAAMWRAIVREGHWQGEIWNRKKTGEMYAELLTISALRDRHGKTINYIGLFSDITESKQQQEALELLAHYDPLTKLPNRSLFADRFNQAIAHSKRTEALLAVCYLDLDGFKQVNDSHGHEVGDELLVEVAKRIKQNLREGDTVCRLGGDEFVLLFENLQSQQQCEDALQRIHQALAEHFTLGNRLIRIAASSGVTIYPLDKEEPEILLRHADQAMYQAKLAGRNGYRIYQQLLDHRKPGHYPFINPPEQIIDEIQQALAQNQLTLYYQPKVNIATGSVIGAEALIRWQHPRRGLLPPAAFLPLVESTPLEIEISNWVIRQVFQQLQIWLDQGLKLQVGVNVSPRFLQWQNFLLMLESILADFPAISSRQLELEVLESSVLDDLISVGEILKQCYHRLGIPSALDDFGTGYSSLTHLRHLAINTVKIDQSFVRDMIDNPDDQSIVESVIGLANAFKREVVAEGVEDIDHGIMLLNLGCNLAQGYAIARPMPADAITGWVAGYQNPAVWNEQAQSHRNPGQTQLALLQLQQHHWLSRLRSALQTPAADNPHWPIINPKKTHLGRWLARNGNQSPPDATTLRQQLSHHLKQQCELAAILQKYHQQGDNDAIARLSEQLRQTNRDIDQLLQALQGLD